MFSVLPSMRKALGHVQKMLDVNRGMRPIVEKGVSKSKKVEFLELLVDDKSQVLFVQAIRSQTDKFKIIVAVINASALVGIRKHWYTLPGEIKEIVGAFITDSDSKGVSLNHGDRKWLLADRPVVADGAEVKVVPMSMLTKVVSCIECL
ncbi:hypothetical protein TSUD_250810 [Trifolium subterraneum]|nr:hypothetical protein TSUD_250810 [Trifolium subterraneum]